MKDTEDTKIDVIAVGGISIDYIFKINKLPKKNMASLLLEHGTFYGGRAPNVSVVLAKLGFNSAIISVAGNDFRKMGYEEYLKNLKIVTTGLAINQETKTTQIYLFVDIDGHNHTYVDLGSEEINQSIIKSYDNVWKELVNQTTIIHVSSGNPALNKKILKIRRDLSLKIPVSFDVGNDIFFHDEKYLREILNETTFLFMNEFEFGHLNGILHLHEPTDIFNFAGNIKALSIVYKNRRVELYTKDRKYCLPKIKNMLEDFTGTSDAYVSGFIAGYLKGFDYIRSMALGQILMIYIGSKLGAQTCVPTWESVQEQLEKYIEGG